MTAWQYDVEMVDLQNVSPLDLNQALNNKGDKGWEVVSVINNPKFPMEGLIVIMKKPK